MVGLYFKYSKAIIKNLREEFDSMNLTKGACFTNLKISLLSPILSLIYKRTSRRVVLGKGPGKQIILSLLHALAKIRSPMRLKFCPMLLLYI